MSWMCSCLRVYNLLFRRERFLFPRREIQFQYRVGGTYRCAFATEPAFIVYNKREVILNSDGIKFAYFLALGAPNASYCTCFFRDGPFVLIHAAHVDAS